MRAISPKVNLEELATQICNAHGAISGFERMCLDKAKEAGDYLITARREVLRLWEEDRRANPTWNEWCSKHLTFTDRTANNYIEIASHWDLVKERFTIKEALWAIKKRTNPKQPTRATPQDPPALGTGTPTATPPSTPAEEEQEEDTPEDVWAMGDPEDELEEDEEQEEGFADGEPLELWQQTITEVANRTLTQTGETWMATLHQLEDFWREMQDEME
jgi:hypothetical protein